MFKGMQKRGEDTPLDHMPEIDFSFHWFIDAYNVLSHSGNENGSIPLSELKVFENSFGLIGSFSEFAKIIYAISDAYSQKRIDEAGT